MPSFRCSICLDALDATSKPMTTLCGHIYCLDCATFRFSTQPSCAICRKPQALDKMIRLYPDCPISVRSMDKAAEEAVETVKFSIADKVEQEDALMVCNTFVNSVTDREKPHLNTELLRELSFQLALMSTKMKDEHARLKKMTKNVQTTRNIEARLTAQIEKQRSTMDRLEKEKACLSTQLDTTRERMAALQRQSSFSSEDAGRQRVNSAKVQNQLEEMQKELDYWKQQALKAKKKYIVLKNKVIEADRALPSRSHCSAHDGSDDLLVVG
ncbi:hypothetical protein L226DRAFT_550534 [Lentinus tigrinus ALCF2SS1-7]|uniref:RING-type domain-containing protein n=1 Tax=Lentinus tigrinus ALCF2SS1-6 TaxID=1328759 RepID=A0A5C2T2P7_9APHY|nr:hypothetical protein L227DRAFT_649328 [Lentinus tigrinus ALCF2SS1-6]RPD80587.1 hypothetical protein L226DRAFT_550534 [Lentinus tigrinus ALCF2SS1-7]